MYYAYILISKNGQKTYTGHTAEFDRRFIQHNNGEVRSTKKFRPYEILKIETFLNLAEAKKREKYYKNYRGRQQIKRLIERQNAK